jgi:hypothetical protein
MIPWLLILALQIPVTPAAKTAIHAPRERIGGTYQSLTAIAGERVRRFDVRKFENPHTDIPGAQYTVDYGGITVTFFSHPLSSDILVTAVDVTEMKWLAPLGITFGDTRPAIEARLGRPIKSDAATLHYEDEEGSDIGPSTLTLSFDGQRLRRASWTFPWD